MRRLAPTPLLHALVLLVSGLWCGALLSFATFVARTVLSFSPSRAAGGEVNREILDTLDLVSYGAATFLILLVVPLLARGAQRRLSRLLSVRLLLLALGLTFASHLVITPEMVSIRERLPVSIEAVPKGDPLRKAWGRLHALSSAALLLRIGAAAGLFLLVYPRSETELPGAG